MDVVWLQIIIIWSEIEWELMEISEQVETGKNWGFQMHEFLEKCLEFYAPPGGTCIAARRWVPE